MQGTGSLIGGGFGSLKMKPTLRPSARRLVFLAIISLLIASVLYSGYSVTTPHTAFKTHQVKEAAGKNEPYSTTYKTTTEAVLKQIPPQKGKTTPKTKVKEVERKNETNSTYYLQNYNRSGVAADSSSKR